MKREEILKQFQIELLKFPIDWTVVEELLAYIKDDYEYIKQLEELRDRLKQYENQTTMKKQKVERKQDPHFIRTYWWDLKQTAADLNVPVSIVVQAMEITETNRRDVVINHIRQWTPITTARGAAINIPFMTKNEPKSLEQIKLEAKYNNLFKHNKKLFGEDTWRWPIENRFMLLHLAMDAGIKVNVTEDWMKPSGNVESTVEFNITTGKGESYLSKEANPYKKEVHENSIDGGKTWKGCDDEIEDLDEESIKKEQILFPFAMTDGVEFTKEGITSVEQPNAGEISGGYINTIKSRPLTPDECYKRFVYQVTEIKQGFWSKFRRARHFRLEIFAKGETINVVPQWLHAITGLQGYDKCKVELIKWHKAGYKK